MIKADLLKIEIKGSRLEVQAELTAIMSTILENHEKFVGTLEETKRYILCAVHCAMLTDEEIEREIERIQKEFITEPRSIPFDDDFAEHAEAPDPDIEIQEMFKKEHQKAEKDHQKTVAEIQELEEMIGKART